MADQLVANSGLDGRDVGPGFSNESEGNDIPNSIVVGVIVCATEMLRRSLTCRTKVHALGKYDTVLDLPAFQLTRNELTLCTR